MSGEEVINIEINASMAFMSMEQLQKFADDTDMKVEQVRRKAMSKLSNVVSVTMAVVGLTRNALRMVGIILDPVQTALLNVLVSVMQTIYATAAAIGATGIGLPFAAFLSAFAVGIELGTIPHIISEMNGAKAQMDNAVATVNSMQTLVNSLTIWGG